MQVLLASPFPDEETEARDGEVPCPESRPHSLYSGACSQPQEARFSPEKKIGGSLKLWELEDHGTQPPLAPELSKVQPTVMVCPSSQSAWPQRQGWTFCPQCCPSGYCEVGPPLSPTCKISHQQPIKEFVGRGLTQCGRSWSPLEDSFLGSRG